MNKYYYAILEAAFDVTEWQDALDCGSPAGAKHKKAYRALLDACAAWADENDGRLVLPEDLNVTGGDDA